MSRILYSLCGADQQTHYSPHVWKVIMALRHKNLAFEMRPISFGDIPKIEDGSFKTVPILNDQGRLKSDSFEIAAYLDETYKDPSLLGGPVGQALGRFVEAFTDTVVHPSISAAATMGMLSIMTPEDQAHFRAAREHRHGVSLEAFCARGPEDLASLSDKLIPIRALLRAQKWIGGDAPLYADYVLFGALQWERICCASSGLQADDPVTLWFERCLDLHEGIGRSVAAAFLGG